MTRRFGRRWIIGGALLVFLALTGCKTAPCPSGSKLMGSPPPEGTETYCQQLDSAGKPMVDADGKPLKNGQFTLYYPNGAKMMEGDYKNGKQDGFWRQYYDSGQQSALNEYHDGVMNGLHVLWHPNAQKAEEGQYVNGKREGKWRHWDIYGLKNWSEEYKNDVKVVS